MNCYKFNNKDHFASYANTSDMAFNLDGVFVSVLGSLKEDSEEWFVNTSEPIAAWSDMEIVVKTPTRIFG